MLLTLEDAEQTEAVLAAEKESRSAVERSEATRRRRRNRGALPTHLPRALDRRRRFRAARRPAGAFPRNRDAASQIPLPGPRARGRAGAGPGAADRRRPPTEATVAHVLVSKYADPFPFIARPRYTLDIGFICMQFAMPIEVQAV
jgi:hypothetical protein